MNTGPSLTAGCKLKTFIVFFIGFYWFLFGYTSVGFVHIHMISYSSGSSIMRSEFLDRVGKRMENVTLVSLF